MILVQPMHTIIPASNQNRSKQNLPVRLGGDVRYVDMCMKEKNFHQTLYVHGANTRHLILKK